MEYVDGDIENITSLRLQFRTKNKKKYIGASFYRQGHETISLWYGLEFMVNQKRKNKISVLGKVDDRIPILQLTRSKSKKSKGTEI